MSRRSSPRVIAQEEGVRYYGMGHKAASNLLKGGRAPNPTTFG